MFGLIIALAIGASALAIIYGLILIRIILKQPTGNKRMADIAKAISDGAKAYLNRQYGTIAVVAVVLFVILLYTLDWKTAVGFLIGAILSATAGYIGMNVSVRANVRVTETSRKGLSAGFSLAFKAGSSIGMLVVGLSLLSVVGFYAIFRDVNALIGLALGGSLISIFARLGGGIFTKGADVGTDLVGKIEAHIPEDDPRNPGVIADNVGDNVGDCAGTAADIFETYTVTAVAAILLGSLAFTNFDNAIFYPLILGAAAILASGIGILFARLPKSKNIMAAFYKSLAATVVLAAIGFYFITKWLMKDNGAYNLNYLFFSSLIGLIVTVLIFIITEYYTSKKYAPVKSIVTSSTTGIGPNIITGLAISMRSTALPIIVIAAAILGAYSLAGIYGIAIAAMSMLSVAGTIVAIDAFGPVVDNAGGIAKMADLPPDVRAHTDALDSAGNIGKAVTKGYAIASAGLASLVLFSAYIIELMKEGQSLSFDLINPYVIVGLLIGGLLPYYFSSLSMDAVLKAGSAIAVEVRRQFRDVKGIMQSTVKPDYKKAVDIVTRVAISQMVLPAIIVVTAPIFVGFVLGPVALGGLLIGTIITGLFLAISMTNGGGAFDNAKKSIEELNNNASVEARATATAGDIVGDPYKDTAGPAINPMIKVVNIIALLIVPLIAIEISLTSKIIIAAVAAIAVILYLIFGNRAVKKAQNSKLKDQMKSK